MREQVPQVAPFLRVGGREWYLPTALSALNHRGYRLFWAGQLVSLVGSWMQSTAQQWLVFRLTGSALALGKVTLCGALPITLFSLFAGVVVDRVDRRRFIIALQVAMMIPAITLAVLVHSGAVRYWHVLVLASLTGLANTFDMPARNVFTVEMVGRPDLMNAIALNSSIFNGARLVGPAVAGLLIARYGEATAFGLNALSFLAVIGALLAMDVPHAIARKIPGRPLAELAESFRYIGAERSVLALSILATLMSIFGFSFTTLIPVVAKERLGLDAGGFGLLISSMGLGALIGAVSLATMGRRHAWRLLAIAPLVFAGALALFAWSRWVLLSRAALVLAGWGVVAHLATTNTLLQLRVPDALRGRVMAAYLWGVIGSAPIGNLLMGALADRRGTPFAIACGASACAVIALAGLVLVPRPGPEEEAEAG